MATITNQASTSYQFASSSEVLTTNSNVNEITLENSQGLNITKTSNTNTFSSGDIITYTINITNNSNQYLTGVRIIDNLGGGNLAYVLGSAKLTVGTLTYSVNPVATNPLTFTLQQLNVGQSMTLTYNSQVIFNLPQSVQSITNTVQGIGYTSTGTINGFASNTIQKKSSGDFFVTKTTSKSIVYPNQPISYYITLSNNTSSNVVSSTTTDVLPNNFIVTSVWLKVDNNNDIELSESDYTLVNSTITIPSGATFPVTVPANGKTIITINGYFI